MVNIDFGDDLTTQAQVDKKVEIEQTKPRTHLGLSQVGHKCDRFLWYQHNGYGEFTPPLPARVCRIFDMGNLVESEMFFEYNRAGFDIKNTQKEVGFTQGDLKLFGHIDGIIHNLIEAPKTPHLWECKSMADKYYKAVVKHGYEAYKPEYKAQVHVYMLGLGLSRCFVTVYNKNTSEVYTERIKIDEQYAIDILQRAFDIMGLKTAPVGTCPDGGYFEAKFCNYCDYCFNGKRKA